MNAIPLINNAPRPNINVGSIGSPAFNPVAASAKLGGSIGGNVMRQNSASMPVNNETQLRQEVNTSIVALKREAFSLENLIAQAAQTLQDINKRLSELEGKQGDYVKKADATVESVGGSGKYISAISETDGKISATATDLGNMVPVDTVTSGNMHSVTSNAVNTAVATANNHKVDVYVRNDTLIAPATGWRSICWIFPKAGTYLVEVFRDKNVTTNIQKIENGVTTSYETIGSDYMRYAIMTTTVNRAQVQIVVNATSGVTYNFTLKLTQVKYV